MWILFSLLAAFFYATATMVSKFSISKVVRDQKGIVVVHALTAMLFIALVWLLRGRPDLANGHDVILALIDGALIGFAAILYFKAFNMEDASMITLLTQIVVPFTMLGGVIFLHDTIGLLQLVAAAIILSGVVMATWSRKGFHLNSTKVIPIMLCATLLSTAIFLISKAVVNNNDTIAFTFYQTVGYLVCSVFLTITHGPTRRGYIKNMHPFHARMILVIGGAEIIFTLAVLAQLKGFQYVNAGLVISVGASEVFISILIGYMLTRFFPHIISEKIDKKTVGRKVIAGVMIVSGIAVLNFVS